MKQKIVSTYSDGKASAELHPIQLFDFSDIDDEDDVQTPSQQTIRTLPKIRTRIVCANDSDTLEDCFDTEPPPVFSFDEKVELHKVLLEQSCNELNEAIQTRDYDVMQDILSWFDDATWRPYSFPVCAALSDVEPDVFLSQIALHLHKNGINKEFTCLNNTN